MRRVIVPAVAAAILATTAFAFAFAAETANGTVKAYDKSAMTLTLDSGSLFHLPKGWKDPGIKTGEEVAVTYDTKYGERMASAVVIKK